MDLEELFDNSADDLPMSNAYKLLCEDIASSTEETEKDRKLIQNARTVAKSIETAKLKHSFEYKNCDYWASSKIVFPLERCQAAIKNTTSNVEKFTWISPKNIVVLVETVASTAVTIFVTIPTPIFGTRDFLNLTYPTKRAHYACAVASLLRKQKYSLKFVGGGQNRDDLLFPDLVVETKEGNIRITFTNGDFVKNQRFIPTVGNLRPATVFPGTNFAEEVLTPQYNQRCLGTIVEKKLRTDIENKLKKKRSACIAIRLLQRFLKNRNFDNISSLLIPSRVLRLINQTEITDKQQTLTILRILFKDLISWDPENIQFVEENSLDDSIEESYGANYELNLIYDFYNIAHKISKNDFLRLKSELITCFPLLGDVYCFDALFVDRMVVHAQYDHFAQLTVKTNELKHLVAKLGDDVADNNDLILKFVKTYEKLIGQTMEERYEHLSIEKHATPQLQWNVVSSADDLDEQVFLIGFRAKKQWSSPLTVGPPAQNEEAKDFRALWKGASELRKFADTRICECVVWDAEANDNIPFHILQFILQKMLEVPGTWLSCRNFDHSKILLDKESTEPVTNAFAGMSAVLRSIKGLPLMITNVHGISPYIRGTEPILPSVFAAPSAKCDEDHVIPELDQISPYTPTVTIHVKLEYSGKWGNDVEAIRRLTSSFYIKIAEKLRELKLIAVPTIDQLFVLKDGIVFKIIIVHDRILEILEQAVEDLKDSGATRIESSTEGMRLTAWKKRFVVEPLLQLSLQSFAASHRIFANTVQIFKRWIGSKLLSGHLDDVIIELLVVAAISKKGESSPQSSWCAFVRALHLISTHNWLARPLVVDLAKSWTEDERRKLEESFIKMRPVLPPMVVVTDEDLIGSKFTREHPSGIVLKRLIGLASEALNVLEKNIIGKNKVDLDASLLKEDYSPYDGIIELNHSAVVRKKGILERKANAKRLPVVEFDPIDELVYQLNNNFHQVAMFFYNKYGGLKIAIKFKPTEEEVPSKIGRCLLHKSVNDSVLRLNKAEIVENIKIMGRGIVSDVIVKC